MKELIAVDSICLISLERVATLEVLPALFQPIIIPPEVNREFGTSHPWLEVEAPADHALVNALKMMIDEGEGEAIALANERRIWRQGKRVVRPRGDASPAATACGLLFHRERLHQLCTGAIRVKHVQLPAPVPAYLRGAD